MKKFLKSIGSNPFKYLFFTLLIIFLWKGSSIDFYKITLPLVGVCLFYVGVTSYIDTKKNMKDSNRLNGLIIDIKTETDGDGYTTSFPVFEYFDENLGEKSTYKSRNGYLPGKFKVGQIVDLLVCKSDNKSIVYINTKYDIWGHPTIGISFGIASCLAGLFIIIKY